MSQRDEEKRLTVPKFSSFKSEEPAQESRGRNDKARSSDRDKRSRSHRSDRRHTSDRRRHEPRQHRHHEHEEHHSLHKRHEDKDNPRSASDRSSLLRRFVVDTRGDPLAAKYGGIERSHIPAYYRHGAGRILGSDGRLVIHRDGPRDRFSIRMPGEGASLSGDRDGLGSKRLRFSEQPFRLRKRNENAVEEETQDFLSVNPRKRKQEQQGDSSSEEDEQLSYRSIDGKAKPRQDVDSDESDSDSSVDAGGADSNDPLKRKSTQLNRHVKEHPEDFDSWLELVDHQDTLLRASGGLERMALRNEAHSYAEIKVSMLESALSNTSNPEGRNRVLVRLMQEGSKVWSNKTAAKKWTEVSNKDEGNNFMLWKTRLDSSMANIGSFHYDRIKAMLLDRLHHVLSCSSPEPSRSGVEEAIYIFLRATRFTHDAGYKELAVAAWQGLLELQLFRPPQIQGQRAALDAFQDFWESEAPRLGDEDAQGWRQYVQGGGVVDPPEPLKDDACEASSSRDPHKAWGSAERFRAGKAQMPARTMDEGTEDDPFRVVMYSDIEPLLFLIPENVLADVVAQLIDAFLLFCGLPPLTRSSDWTEMACHDQFLVPFRGAIWDETCSESDAADGSGEISRRTPRFSSGEIHARVSADLLFSGASWFQFPALQDTALPVERRWMLAAVKQLVHMAEIEGLAPYHMALSFLEDPTNIRKPAKALLKRYSTNIQLYYGYALAEHSGGNHDVASNVLKSAMGIASASETSSRLLFWRAWSWIELEMGDKAKATRRLCSSVDENLRNAPEDGARASSSHTLKAQQAFSSGAHESLAGGNINAAGAYAECHVLLSYLTADGCTEPISMAQGNVSAAMHVVDAISRDFSSWRQEHTAAHERFLQFAARLLYFNASGGAFRRGFMQEQLSRFIDLFPQNTIFLSLFEWSDSSLRVIDETRSVLYEKVLLPPRDCVSSRAFSIRHELARGNANSTKAAYEQALSSDACRASAWLWASYVGFSASRREIQRGARDVFYRALRHCPWSKGLMMEAFWAPVREMGADQLRAVYETMASKGLRIHVDLEEFLKERRGDDIRKGSTRGRLSQGAKDADPKIRDV